MYPIVENSFILMLNEDGSIRSYRKSPKHGNFYQIFKELSGIAQLIDDPNLSIRIVYIDCEIIKIDDKKGRSRYKHPRIIDKKLLKIHRQEKIKSNQDLIDPLLGKLPKIFTSMDMRNLAATGTYTSYIISFLKKSRKITYHTKEGRYQLYKKTGA